eukprot:91731_1
MSSLHWHTMLLLLISYYLIPLNAFESVSSIEVYIADEASADSGNVNVAITLWFDSAIYNAAITSPQRDTLYGLEPILMHQSDCENTSYPRIMIENNHDDSLIIDWVKFTTNSNEWYGINAHCSTPQDVIYYQNNPSWSYWTMNEPQCDTGMAEKFLCIDNQEVDGQLCPPYKQILHFDTTKPKQFATSPVRASGVNVTPQVTTCQPVALPTEMPTNVPTNIPTNFPTNIPTNIPTYIPTNGPTNVPTNIPTTIPTIGPAHVPINRPMYTNSPSNGETNIPINQHSTQWRKTSDAGKININPEDGNIFAKPWAVISAAIVLLSVLIVIILACTRVAISFYNGNKTINIELSLQSAQDKQSNVVPVYNNNGNVGSQMVAMQTPSLSDVAKMPELHLSLSDAMYFNENKPPTTATKQPPNKRQQPAQNNHQRPLPTVFRIDITQQCLIQTQSPLGLEPKGRNAQCMIQTMLIE